MLVFSPKVCEKKRSLPQSVGFRSLKEKKNKQMVSPQNGDTWGGPPPLPLSDATEVATVTGIHFQNKVAINRLAYFTDFSFSPFSAYRSITKNNGNTHAISKLHSRAQEIAMFGLHSVADLGGGMGGDASPPTSLKVTILAEKSASISNNSAPVRDASPHKPKPNEPGRKITLNFGEDLFFFLLETT